MSEKPKRESEFGVQPPSRCPVCGGTAYERGAIIGSIGYQEFDDNDNLPIFTRPKGIAAFRCLNCNHLEFSAHSSLMQHQQSREFQMKGLILLILLPISFIMIAIMIFFMSR